MGEAGSAGGKRVGSSPVDFWSGVFGINIGGRSRYKHKYMFEEIEIKSKPGELSLSERVKQYTHFNDKVCKDLD